MPRRAAAASPGRSGPAQPDERSTGASSERGHAVEQGGTACHSRPRTCAADLRGSPFGPSAHHPAERVRRTGDPDLAARARERERASAPAPAAQVSVTSQPRRRCRPSNCSMRRTDRDRRRGLRLLAVLPCGAMSEHRRREVKRTVETPASAARGGRSMLAGRGARSRAPPWNAVTVQRRQGAPVCRKRTQSDRSTQTPPIGSTHVYYYCSCVFVSLSALPVSHEAFLFCLRRAVRLNREGVAIASTTSAHLEQAACVPSNHTNR